MLTRGEEGYVDQEKSHYMNVDPEEFLQYPLILLDNN